MHVRNSMTRMAAITGICLFLQWPALMAQRLAPKKASPEEIAELKKKVMASPDSISYHEEYIKAVTLKDPGLIPQYEAWSKEYPGKYSIPFAIATALYEAELPEATPWLKKSVELNPKLAEAYQMLSIDADRWGDAKAARDYMGKASETEPSNPSYAFYYAMDFEHDDPALWRKKLYELAKKFPAHERGAQGLYWLATRSTDNAEKVRVYEMLIKQYNPSKFNWSGSGASGLYEFYLAKDPAKAAALAKRMGKERDWPSKDTVAQQFVQLKKLVAARKFSKAKTVAGKIRLGRYSSAGDQLLLLKSAIIEGQGNTKDAYDSLLIPYAKKPSDELYAGLNKLGNKLGITTAQTDAAIDEWRKANSKPAPAFNLGLYTSDKTVSLDDYKGKVVLLTFWFPGCGPCRGEFPHFEKVLKKFEGKEIAYIAINGIPEQDEYVLPFVKGTKYTFTPLRTKEGWAEEAYKVRGYPSNFLIDQEGKIVFSNFMIHDEPNERMLELMISALLARS
ncbi:MAG: redoxin domain-containing protein [Chitinophagaceae bacterium]|nr:redoxin domain-containing protein [Chitinophagaceae bacterium]